MMQDNNMPSSRKTGTSHIVARVFFSEAAGCSQLLAVPFIYIFRAIPSLIGKVIERAASAGKTNLFTTLCLSSSEADWVCASYEGGGVGYQVCACYRMIGAAIIRDLKVCCLFEACVLGMMDAPRRSRWYS